MTKKELRQAVKKSKALLTDDAKMAAAERVFARIEEMPQFEAAVNVLVYNSLPDELPTGSFIDKWAGRKHLYLPRVNGDDLDILPYDSTTLQRGAFNIDEPQGDNTVDPAVIDLIIVPGVAFDRRANRLGRGRGYYDRLLSQTTATTIGVGYDCQLVDAIATEPHDIAMNFVVTPETTVSR
jgi:5-formyltetrahydrofolate cyclo-ligase